MKVPLGIFLFVSVLFLGCNEKSKKKVEPSFENVLQDKNTLSRKTTHISGLTWYLNIEDGLKQAKIENKRMIVMVSEESCRWCKKMKESTLLDVRIQNRLKEYILVSVKRSDTNAVKHLERFDGNIPSFFFMKEDKELIESIVGYFKADDFLEYIHEIEE